MNRLGAFIIVFAALGSESFAAQLPLNQSAEHGIAASARDSVAARVDSTAPILVTARPAGLSNPHVFETPSFMQDTTRRKAVTYSDWYARRLRVHRYGSYAMLPLFVTQYVLGDRLLDQKNAQFAGTRLTPIDENLRSTHAIVAGTVGALFLVNTTTGLWNLFASRHTVEGRKLRTIHALTMLAADAGFAYTGYLGSQTVDRGPAQGRKHRNVGLVSFGIATGGASLMWFKRD